MTNSTMTIDQKEKINLVILEFSKDKDIINIVNKIESRIATTQDHYGDYMSFLSKYADKFSTLYIISEAMKKAGGNVKGINWAIRLLKGE